MLMKLKGMTMKEKLLNDEDLKFDNFSKTLDLKH